MRRNLFEDVSGSREGSILGSRGGGGWREGVTGLHALADVDAK